MMLYKGNHNNNNANSEVVMQKNQTKNNKNAINPTRKKMISLQMKLIKRKRNEKVNLFAHHILHSQKLMIIFVMYYHLKMIMLQSAQSHHVLMLQRRMI